MWVKELSDNESSLSMHASCAKVCSEKRRRPGGTSEERGASAAGAITEGHLHP